MGDELVDSIAQVFLSQQLSSGNLSLQELYYNFGPYILAISINTFLSSLLGASLTHFYLLGIINSILIFLIIYLIARSFNSLSVTWTILFVVITAFAIQVGGSNYILPYSSATLYATFSFLCSILFMIYYFKTSKFYYIGLASLFYGLSITFKYDYLLLIVVIALLVIFMKQLSIKNVLLLVILILVAPLSYLLYLLLNGISFNDINDSFNHIIKLSRSSYMKFFYTNGIGYYFSFKMLKLIGVHFLISIAGMSVLLAVYYCLLSLVNNLNNKVKLLVSFFIVVMSIIFFSSVINIEKLTLLFSWVPWTTIIILLVTIYVIFKKIKENQIEGSFKNLTAILNLLKSFDTPDKLFVLVLLCSLIPVNKGLFFINPIIYGSFLLIIPLIINIKFLIDYIPKVKDKINDEIWKRCCIMILLTIGATFLCANLIEMYTYKTVSLINNQGILYTQPIVGADLNEAIKYINANIPPDKSIIVYPENHILNTLTNHKSGILITAFNPLWKDSIEENVILNKFKRAFPDYILTTAIKGEIFQDYTIKDYSPKLDKFVSENYEQVTQIGKVYKITVYKALSKPDNKNGASAIQASSTNEE